MVLKMTALNKIIIVNQYENKTILQCIKYVLNYTLSAFQLQSKYPKY